MIVTIHQPEHLPWLGFFDKVRQADVWVMLDHVQYRKNYFQNRNRIRTDRGALWLTVPVLTGGKLDQPICAVQINNQGSPRWRDKCWTSLTQNYRKARYWKEHEAFFTNLYQTQWKRLVDINEAIIRYLLAALSIEAQVIKSSKMELHGQREDLLLDICQRLGADIYLSGISGRDYLDLGKFATAGIEVHFQEFHHPIYQQLHGPFLPCMSVVDLLFNYGPKSLDIIKGISVPTMEQVFE